MTLTPRTIRIFISSPGDVVEERDGARRVVEGLQRMYPGTRLLPVLWEELALPATASFQETIDFLLGREPIDVAVFILWSRLGSPLGAAITRPDGTPYRSGTERELDLMLTAFEQSGRQRPVILAYVRDDDAGFKRKLAETPKSEIVGLIDQQQLAEAFIIEQFHDAEGRNLRAYQTYREPVGFVQRLRLHLRNVIDDLLGADAAPSWTDEPYRGLEVFDLCHAAIFHGREEETCQLLQRLRDQEQAGCAFAVILGASGSGKSSLARAGVAANLVQYAGDDDSTQWHAVTFIPALAAGDLCAALVCLIAEQLPQWNEAANTLDDIAESLAENAALTVRLSIAPAFSRASEQAGRKVRLLLILDQLEELWTDRHTTSQDRERFFAAIEALASSGHVMVLATLRSDFYHHAQEMPVFLRLKGRDGQYDLLPPDAASIQRLITEPARLSGLRFERNEKTGRSLDEVIFQDAARDPHALPLLEYTLAELYRQRDEGRRLMTFAAYVELGGVEGAIGKRADETFATLPPEAQAALDDILPLLVSVDIAGEQSAVRRRASEAELTSTPARKTLVDHLVAARFLTTDRQDDTPIASFAHEALLRRWDRIVNWISVNREQLRLRSRVEQTQQRWEEQDRNDSLLLAEGLPLDEGRQLLNQAPYLLTPTTSDYIHASIAYNERKAKQSRRQRAIVLSTIAALLVVMVVGGLVMRSNSQKTVAKGLVQRLLQANTAELPAILTELSDYRELTRDELATAYASSEDKSNAKLHAALALLPDNDSLLPFITERLLRAEPAQVEMICSLLKEHRNTVVAELWPVLESPDSDQQAQLLHAASGLAMYDGSNTEKWNAVAQRVADRIVSENPLRLAVWLNTLRPVRQYLVPPLSDVFRSDPSVRPQSEIDLATNVLEDYAADDVNMLSELLVNAEPKQFVALFDELVLAAPTPSTIEELGKIASTLPSDEMGSVERVPYGQHRANAAITLLRLGEREKVMPVFEMTDDPEAMTQFIFRCRDRGVRVDELLECLRIVSDGPVDRFPQNTRYALLLGLGEYKLNDIQESQREPLLEKLGDWYRNDPSSGVHGAAGWLLRQWGQHEIVRQVDQTAVPYAADREWFTLAITVTPTSPPKPAENPANEDAAEGAASQDEETKKKDESDSTEPAKDEAKPESPPEPLPSRIFYYTFVVFPPGEALIGSVEDEPERSVQENDELRHVVNLTRPFALLDREVTFEELIAFSPDYAGFMQQFKAQPVDAGFGPHWYDSVSFCRWLSQQSGLSESDQSYADPESLSKEEYPREPNPETNWAPRDWPLELDRRGFRLPTESEWEVASRAGSRTTYGYGSDVALLDRFGWFQENSGKHVHPPRELRPGSRGLFDVHGNLFEWTHDWYSAYDTRGVADPVGTNKGSRRVNRGGGWDYYAADCRTAYRFTRDPTYRTNGRGFRLALSSPSIQSPEAEESK